MTTTMMEPGIVSNAKKFKGMEIKPLLGSGPAGMGMEQHGMVIHDGAAQLDYPMFFVEGGIVTYITGLNEDGPEVLSLHPDSQKEKIMEIRRVILKCENELAGNYKVSIKDIEDKEKFYEHVKTFRSVFPAEYIEYPTTKAQVLVKRYWDKLDITLRNEGYALNQNDLQDKLRIYIIEAGGYGMIAPSYVVGKEKGVYNFYLDKPEEVAKENVTIHMQRNKAGAKLETMYDKDSNRLFYVTKMISMSPLSWRTGQNSSPKEQMYIECNKFLDGEGRTRVKREAINEFMRWAEMPMDDLKIHCYLEDGLKLGLFNVLSDGSIKFVPTATILGKGKDNAFAFLKSGGENEPVYKAVSKECELLWKDNN